MAALGVGHRGGHGIGIVLLVLIVLGGGFALASRRRRSRPPEVSSGSQPAAAPAPATPPPAVLPSEAAPSEAGHAGAVPTGGALTGATPAGGAPTEAAPVWSARAELATAPRSVAPGSGTASIVARGLTKHYGEKTAVDDLSFEVRSGHVTGFLGPNGAGKSTTMRMIMGLDAPNAGSVEINGRRYHDLAWPLREVGALLEAKAVHPGRSAYSHLWMLARANRIPRGRVDEVLDLVGLTPVARQLVGSFSLGMGQRLGIAEALLGDPAVLLFDEPINGLDTDGIRWVRQLLRRLADEGRAVLVSSHLMSEMALTADQLVVIGKGRLLAEMPVEQFTARSSRRYVRVRSPQLALLAPALSAAGATVERAPDGSLTVRGLDAERIGEVSLREQIVLSELAPHSASLEDAFVESTGGDLEFRGADSLATADHASEERS